MDRSAMECAGDARTTSEHARDASERAVESAGRGHHDLWRRHLQQCLTRADQSISMAFDSVDAMMGGTVGSTLVSLPDANSLTAGDMRAAASALQWAADALLHMAAAREPGAVTNMEVAVDSDSTEAYEPADDTNAEDVD